MANPYETMAQPYSRMLGSNIPQGTSRRQGGMFDDLLNPVPTINTFFDAPSELHKQQFQASKDYRAITDPIQRAEFMTQFPGASPEQIAAAEQLKQGYLQQQRTDQARTQGSAFKSAVVDKAVTANKPEDVTLIQSLDPIQDREMLIQYFRTGTFSKPGNNVVVVGNHLYDRKNEKWISGPKTGQKEKRKLLKVELGTGDNKRVRFIDDQTGEQIGEDIVAPDSKNKNSAATMDKIHEANFYLGKKIAPALELLTQSKKDGFLSFDTGGTDAYIKEFFPESDEYKLKNNYYQSLASKEAFNSLEDLRIQAMETGSKGSGLGQITQNEFRALKDVLNRLDQRATIDQQIESLQEIEQRYKNVLRLAGGESPIEILDWDSEYLIESGYKKHEGKIYYKPAYGPSRGYNPDTDRFEILTLRK